MSLPPKKFSLLLILALVLPVVSVLCYNLYIDPFQIFHRDFQQPPIILGRIGTDRYQHAGIINQYSLESVIVGNSHSANYLPSDLGNQLGWLKVYSLTMEGSGLHAQATILGYALKRHEIKNILWGIAIPYLWRRPQHLNPKMPFQAYLYDRSRINDLRFFLTLDLQRYHQIKKKRRDQIIRSATPALLAAQEFDHATSWYNRVPCSFNRPTFVAQKILGRDTKKYPAEVNKLRPTTPLQPDRKQGTAADRSLLRYQENLNLNIVPLLRAHPGTRFDIVLTAFPTLRMQVLKLFQPERYATWLETTRQLVLDLAQYDNVTIHGFATESFPQDLRLYKDPGHYHIEVNRYILERIASGSNRLNKDNIDSYLRKMDRKITTYRLPAAWYPAPEKTIRKTGYLSPAVARRLINGETLSDQEVDRLSLAEKNLPKCAQKIILPCH